MPDTAILPQVMIYYLEICLHWVRVIFLRIFSILPLLCFYFVVERCNFRPLGRPTMGQGLDSYSGTLTTMKRSTSLAMVRQMGRIMGTVFRIFQTH